MSARFALESYVVAPLAPRMRELLLRLPDLTAPEVGDLDLDIAEDLARGALAAMDAADFGRDDLDLIGSHGVTVYHRPRGRARGRTTTLQVGSLAVIAERTGAVTIGDFRQGDVAAGGQGAPLVPYLDHAMFRDSPGTIALNLGGISNLTWIGEQPEDALAFDCGPCNIPLDHITRVLTNGEQTFDTDGRLAAAGHVDQILLGRLSELPYVLAAPPKTTGREEFGGAWVDGLLNAHGHLKLVDILATLTAFAAEAIARAIAEHVAPRDVRTVVASGGGIHNLALMSQLRRRLDPVPLTTTQDLGMDPDAKEAVLFALLANDRVFGLPTNVPAATGASWPVSLGSIVC